MIYIVLSMLVLVDDDFFVLFKATFPDVSRMCVCWGNLTERVGTLLAARVSVCNLCNQISIHYWASSNACLKMRFTSNSPWRLTNCELIILKLMVNNRDTFFYLLVNFTRQINTLKWNSHGRILLVLTKT